MQDAPRYFSSNAGIIGSRDLENRISGGSIQTVGLAEAIITGRAPDGGLFMPTHFPLIDFDTIKGMNDMPYRSVFVEVMDGFFKEVLSKKTLERIAAEAYKFEPLIEPITNRDIIARLDEGPTAAFKDYAAQVFFGVVEALMKEEPKSEIEFRQRLKDIKLLTYIVATSGDTGGAMGVACHKMPNMWMAVLHSSFIPEHVRELQAKQMDTLGDNVYAIRLKTDFDGNASLSSQLEQDPDLRYMNMASANSVNIGRLLPQIAYYFHVYSRITKNGEEVYVSVPSGNFGNAVAGLFARRMGLPIKLVIAVNENDVFARFYNSGVYAPSAKTKSSPSNSMNVNWPSNMRRLFQLYDGQLIEGRDPDNPERRITTHLHLPNLKRMREEIAAYAIIDQETHEIVQRFYEEWHMIGSTHSTIEPHGAVAWAAAQRFRRQTGFNGTIVTLETAHPGKFPESLERMGIKPDLPDCLARLADKPHGRFYTRENEYKAVKSLLIQLYQQELARQGK